MMLVEVITVVAVVDVVLGVVVVVAVPEFLCDIHSYLILELAGRCEVHYQPIQVVFRTELGRPAVVP